MASEVALSTGAGSPSSPLGGVSVKYPVASAPGTGGTGSVSP